VYLESNTLIRVVTKKPGYEPVAELLRLADAGKLTVLISMLTYVEVRGWGKKDPYPEATMRLLSRIRVAPVTKESARRSAGQLKVAGLHGHKYAVDAMVAETPDVDGMVKLCGRRVRTIGL
jgi:hypothetical protein